MNTPRLRLFAALALAGALTVLVQAQPSARTFTSTFVFGDSLSDTGNLFAVVGQPPAPYFNGRFSNGPVYVEQLFPGLRNTVTAPGTVRTNLNFAFGGATAVGSTPVPASLPVQLGLFQARGITPAGGDLFVLLAGANDVLNGIANPATQNNAAVVGIANAASASVTGTVQALAAAGGRNFLVLNLPNIAQTPRFTTGSGVPAVSLAQAGSLAFNSAIRANLAAANLPAGANVTLVDLQALLNDVLQNAPAFGFTVTNRSIVDILTAGGTPGSADGFVFFDSIHPTTKTHAIFARAIEEILNPEFVLGTAGAQGTALTALADMTADSVDARLNQVRHGTNHHRADGYVSYSFKTGGRRFNGYQPGFDFDARVFTAGFDYQWKPDVLVGLAFGKDTISSTVKAGAGNGSFKLQGESGTAYAQWKFGATFAEATVSYGGQDVRNISRRTALTPLATAGKTSGSRYGGSLRLGRDFAGESLHLTPFVGLRYTRGQLDGYTENGVPGLDFSYGEQTVKTVAGLVGASLTYVVHKGELPLVLSLDGVYAGDLTKTSRNLTGRLADNLSSLTTVQVDDGNGDNFKLGARLTGNVGKNWSWTAGLGTELRNDGKDAVQYSLAIQTGF